MSMQTARSLLGNVALCVSFYTRLPVPVRIAAAGDLASAQWAAPLAGLAVAIGGAAMFAALDAMGVPSTVAAAAALAATMMITGCLHEDGLADTADGFGGGATRERKLEIMRDSRIGTYGVAALAVSILLRWSALSALLSPTSALLALAAAHTASRAVLPLFMNLTSPARREGLAASAGRPSLAGASAALAIGFLFLLPLSPGAALVALVLLAALFIGVRALCDRQIGGHTGDVLGALQQGAEILVLCVACVALA